MEASGVTSVACEGDGTKCFISPFSTDVQRAPGENGGTLRGMLRQRCRCINVFLKLVALGALSLTHKTSFLRTIAPLTKGLGTLPNIWDND